MTFNQTDSDKTIHMKLCHLYIQEYIIGENLTSKIHYCQNSCVVLRSHVCYS